MTVAQAFSKLGQKERLGYKLDAEIPEGFEPVAVRQSVKGDLWLFTDFHRNQDFKHKGISGLFPDYADVISWGPVLIVKEKKQKVNYLLED